ncbi:MAG: polyprenyl synthetase family protein [Bacillota bacterium]
MNEIETHQSQFKMKLIQLSKIVEESLVHYLEKCPIESVTLRNAIDYSIKSGGKRIRPVLMLAIAKLYGKPYSLVLPYACALELIHTYSLVHDDLPCMDDDDLRRGKPTSHKVYGEAIAVLAGDAMLNIAHELMLMDCEENLGGLSQIRAAKIISSAAGANGMISGQVIDIEMNGNRESLEAIKKMFSLKTGALLAAPINAAAELCEISQDEKAEFSNFAQIVGLMFQISDDILDYEDKDSVFVKLMGLDSSKKYVDELAKEARKCLGKVDLNTWFLEEMVSFLADRTH